MLTLIFGFKENSYVFENSSIWMWKGYSLFRFRSFGGSWGLMGPSHNPWDHSPWPKAGATVPFAV